MVEDAKPFACSAPGCNRQFAVEDHLTVHKQKHTMLLNLNGSKNADSLADQTPTPTRFIKTCEEVGLFQDLQNPFEETFRKAAEAVKTGSTLSEVGLGVSSLSNPDDTLHTPHIFPTEDSLPSNPLSLTKKPRLDSRDLESSSINTDFGRQELETTSQILLPSPTSSTTQDNNIVFMKLPHEKYILPAIPQENSAKNDKTTTTPSPSSLADEGARLSLAKQKLKETLTRQANGVVRPVIKVSKPVTLQRQNIISSYKSNQDSNNEPEQKRHRLERNRAAAMRCRQKRKKWVYELEIRANQLESKNNHLETEILALRNELSEVKSILLQHRDCPVTQALIQNGMPTGMNLTSRDVVVIPNASPPIIQSSVHMPHTSSVISMSTTQKNMIINPASFKRKSHPQTAELISTREPEPVALRAPTTSSNSATVLVPMALVQPPRPLPVPVAATKVIKLNPFVKLKPSLELRLPERKNS